MNDTAILDEAAIMAVLAKVPDPEIPVVSIVDLGIIRGIASDPPRVLVSPTYTGCPATVAIERSIRDALDAAGFGEVRIVVSGGFDIDKIREFETGEVPVDAYGVGSSLIRGSNDFTADIVLTDGEPSAKVGRRYRPNPRLEAVT